MCSCCTRCQLLSSRKQPQALRRVSAEGSGEQDMSPIRCSSHHHPQQILLAGRQYMGTLCKPCCNLLQPSRGHCTHCCVYTTSRGGKMALYDFYTQSGSVPGTQIKQFSKFGWCLDGRRGPWGFTKCLRLGSTLARAVRMSLH